VFTAEALRANIDWKSAFLLELGQLGPKFQVQVVVPHQPFFVSENWDKLSFIWYKNVGVSSFRFAQYTRLTYRKAFAITCVALHAVARYKLLLNVLVYQSLSQLNRPIRCISPVTVKQHYVTLKITSHRSFSSWSHSCYMTFRISSKRSDSYIKKAVGYMAYRSKNDVGLCYS